MTMRAMRPVASRPMCCQLRPASVERYTPLPRAVIDLMKNVSPVPAHSTLCAEGAMASAPVDAAVLGLPDPARRGADVGHERIPRLADGGDGAIPFRAHEAEVQARPQRRVHLLRGGEIGR